MVNLKASPIERSVFIESLDDYDAVYAHLKYMLNQIVDFIDDGQIEKAYRKLGFVQGVLWLDGHYSIDQLRDHNSKKTG